MRRPPFPLHAVFCSPVLKWGRMCTFSLLLTHRHNFRIEQKRETLIILQLKKKEAFSNFSALLKGTSTSTLLQKDVRALFYLLDPNMLIWFSTRISTFVATAVPLRGSHRADYVWGKKAASQVQTTESRA